MAVTDGWAAGRSRPSPARHQLGEESASAGGAHRGHLSTPTFAGCPGSYCSFCPLCLEPIPTSPPEAFPGCPALDGNTAALLLCLPPLDGAFPLGHFPSARHSSRSLADHHSANTECLCVRLAWLWERAVPGHCGPCCVELSLLGLL